MNQLTWHFGFANSDAAIKLNTTGCLIQSDRSDLASEYAQKAIKHIEYTLTHETKDRTQDRLNAMAKWLNNVLHLEKNILKHNNKLNDEAKAKLFLLFRGHFLELDNKEWFRDYKNNPSAPDFVKLFFNYDQWSAMRSWRRRILKAIGTVICPYCDRQYITSFDSDKEGNKKKTLATLDHFFVKSRYPLFALSLFNFIPACYGCNSVIRGEQDLKFSPYQFGFDQITHFAVRMQIPKDQPAAILTDLLVDFVLEKDTVSFKIEQSLFEHLPESIHEEDVQNDINILRLNEVYAVHQDYVRELMIIRRFYENSEYCSAISDLLGKAIGTEDVAYPVTIEKLRSFLIGGDWLHNPDEAGIPQKRPLAKLTNAILQDDYTLLFPE